jgi:hypothetical protein
MSSDRSAAAEHDAPDFFDERRLAGYEALDTHKARPARNFAEERAGRDDRQLVVLDQEEEVLRPAFPDRQSALGGAASEFR